MNEIICKNDKSMNYNIETMKYLLDEIQKIIQNLKKDKLYLYGLMFYKLNGNCMYDTNEVLTKEVELKYKIAVGKKKLRQRLAYVLLSDYLNEYINIVEKLDYKECKSLLNDIELNLVLLDFEKDDDIWNFIVSYIKKYITDSEKCEAN